MPELFPDEILEPIARMVGERLGLHFPRNKWRDLERALRGACDELGFTGVDDCAQRLSQWSLSRRQLDVLASHLTVGETYFFRDEKLFSAFENEILQPLVCRRRESGEKRLRMWSAGCCTGEEPYSISIIVSRVIPDWQQWAISILATDLNPVFLKKATQGVFGEWSFRDTPPALKAKYFNNVAPGQFEITPALREMVTFGTHNLAEDAFPSLLNNTNAMDVIFCRNVLMYFSEAQARKVITQFHACLIDQGWLIVSPTETSPVRYVPFESVKLSDLTVYRKKPAAGITPSVPTADVQSVRPEKSPEPLHVNRTRHRQPLPTIANPKPVHQADRTYANALALYGRGDYPAAIDQLHKVVEQHPTDAKAHQLLARALANHGDLGPALQSSERALKLSKLDPELHYLRATILVEKGSVDAAIDAFRRALFLDNHFVLAHFALGNCALNKRHWAEAGKHFGNALTLLEPYPETSVVPGSDGISAGRLRETIRTAMRQEEVP